MEEQNGGYKRVKPNQEPDSNEEADEDEESYQAE